MSDSSGPMNPATGTPSNKMHRRKSRGTRNLLEDNSKFLANFDPGVSRREKRKLAQSIPMQQTETRNRKSSLYNEQGCLRESRRNLCDCLDFSCPGCHFPCPSCDSPMCGPICRRNRRWMYEQIVHDSKEKIIMNELITKNASQQKHPVKN
uniref:ARF7 effector protein C-terminal domain-containing protein n=1 Tax=Anopheles triannulatus TaxID=58253 RepID=A0A2M4B055_9DIPT